MTPKKMKQLFPSGDAPSTSWLRSHRCACWSVVAVLTLAACGDGGTESSPPLDAAAAACPVPTDSSPAALTGGWGGTLTLTQTLSGKTEQANLSVQVVLAGYPIAQLAALGIIGDWQAYAVPVCAGRMDLQALFVAGGSGEVRAYQPAGVSNQGNRIQVHTTELSQTTDSLRWSYDASYLATDLLHSTLSEYGNPSPPYVQVTATESYTLSGTTLSVQANASGQDDTGHPVSISLIGSLQPLARIYPKSNLR